MGSDGRVKIGDFGFCMELPPGKKAVKVDKVTHPCWTAPEVRHLPSSFNCLDVYET